MAKLAPAKMSKKATRERQIAPAWQSATVTPDDAADIEQPGATLFIGVGGELHCWLFGDDVAGAHRVFKNVPSGYDTPFAVRRVKETTTCTDIIQLW